MGNYSWGIYSWPPRCRLAFYERRTKLLFTDTDRSLDLNDALLLHWDPKHRTVYMGVSTKSPRWKRWNEQNLQKIEASIKYDITWDGDHVRITRLGTKGVPCSEEFLWKLQMRQQF